MKKIVDLIINGIVDIVFEIFGSYLLEVRSKDVNYSEKEIEQKTKNHMRFNFRVVLSLIAFSILTCSVVSAQNVQYKYDNKNQLVEVSYPNNMTVKYTYDLDGNRIQQSTFRTASASLEPLDSADLVKNGIKVYPNPTGGLFQADFNCLVSGDVTITLTDMSGKQVFTDTRNYSAGNHTMELDISPLTPGTYILTIKTITWTKSEKLVKN